jgi:DNA-directed RNA polymerase specialized sigma24 family protein
LVIKKSKLKQYINLVREIDRLEAEKMQILAKLQAPPLPEKLLCGKGQVSDPVGNAAVKLVKISNMIDTQLDKLIDLRQEIEQAIANLEPSERHLMRLRYIDGKRWEEIAVEMHYSIQHVWRLHGIILKKMRDYESTEYAKIVL